MNATGIFLAGNMSLNDLKAAQDEYHAVLNGVADKAEKAAAKK